MLSSRSGVEPQLKVHIKAGLNVGLTREEIEEIIIQTVPYSGFPTAINALNVLKEI
jgi:4-carboxymuconolactone decarboxylase